MTVKHSRICAHWPKDGAGEEIAGDAQSDTTPMREDDYSSAGWAPLSTNDRLLGKEVEVYTEPYRHLFAPSFLTAQDSDNLLSWLESLPDWRLNDGGFFSAFDLVIDPSSVPAEIFHLFSKEMDSALERDLGKLFAAELKRVGYPVAHCMHPGQRVGIHSDGPLPDEDVRLVLTLSRPSHSGDGGDFVICSTVSEDSPCKVIWRKHNSAVVIPLHHDSFHAVTKVENESRFSVIFSFFSNCEIESTSGPRRKPEDFV